jgi:uncharacterized repeat protein (TIGR02543 family)
MKGAVIMGGRKRGKGGFRVLGMGLLFCAIIAGGVLAGVTEIGADAPAVVQVTFADGNGDVKTELIPNGASVPDPGPALALKTYGTTMYFLGWYKEGAPDETPYDFNLPVTEDMTLYAHYRTDYLVSYLNGYGEVFLTKRAVPGAPVPELSAAEMLRFTAPAGRHFDHWLLNNEPASGKRVTSDVTLEPFTNSGSHYVFYLSEGERVPYAVVNDGDAAAKPANPKRDGYIFSYWSEAGPEQSQRAPYDFAAPITADTTLYAVWQPQKVSYHVVFWQERANLPENADLSDPANYEFSYQYRTNTALAGTKVASLGDIEALIAPKAANFPLFAEYHHYSASNPEVLGSGNTVINVYFNRKVYNFHFNLNRKDASMVIGGVRYDNSSAAANQYTFQAKYEQNIEQFWPTVDNAVVNSGNSAYSFHGWLVPGDSVPAVSKILVVTNKLLPAGGTEQEIKADWMTNSMLVDLNYYFESLKGGVPGAVQYNGIYYIRSDVYSQKLYAVGTAFGFKEIEGMKTLPGANKALAKVGEGFQAVPASAKLAEQHLFYDRKTFRLDFNGMGGTVKPVAGLDYNMVKYGAELAPYLPQPPVRNGYVFAGWYYDADYYRPFVPAGAVMGNSNLALYAKWTSTAHTVRFYDDLSNDRLLAAAATGIGNISPIPGFTLRACGARTKARSSAGIYLSDRVYTCPSPTKLRSRRTWLYTPCGSRTPIG